VIHDAVRRGQIQRDRLFAEGRQPLVSGKDGLMVTKIAEAVLASSKTSSPIFVGA